MARLICLYIEDNEAAEAFIKETEETEGHFMSVDPDEPCDSDSVKAGVMVPIAMFAVPTLYCECPQEDRMPITRGANKGWWIHNKPDCYKPLRNSWQSPRNLIAKDPRVEGVHVNWTWQAPPPHLKSLVENASGLQTP